MSEADRSSKEKWIDEARDQLARLVAVKHKLQEHECEFVLQLDEKLRRYGYGAFVSEKQMAWLRILDKRHSPDERQAGLFQR